VTPPLHRPRTVTRLAVCLDAEAADAVERELRAAEVCVTTADDVRPADSGRRACRVRVAAAQQTTTVVEQLLGGVWVIAEVDEPTLASDLYDQGRRLGTAEWFDRVHRPVSEGLSQDQLRLLLQIRRGADIERAARVVHLSPRTAARRLNDARQVLQARSTAEAVARIGRRIDELSS
jgi:DNA-binding NarL/FixJ family response regulator